MFLKTWKAEGLAHLSYMIGTDDEAVVIDPQRDVDCYIQTAQAEGVRITHILETHVHADFACGSPELAKRTGATICVSDKSNQTFKVRRLKEGDSVKLGDELELRALFTPGHTPEHICFLAIESHKTKNPWLVFSGDTMFAEEVGRPDLLGADQTDKLARALYHSLFDKMLKLPDNATVLPCHGEGSSCGANIGNRDMTSIGYEKIVSPALAPRSEAQFVKFIKDSLSTPPPYYPLMKILNRDGAPILDELPGLHPIAAKEISDKQLRDCQLVDVRSPEAFGGAHIPSALNLPMNASLSNWAGWQLNYEQPILIVLDDPSQMETVSRRLVRIGQDKILGYIEGGISGWYRAGREVATLLQLSARDLRQKIAKGKVQLLDVREPHEFAGSHIKNAVNIRGGLLAKQLDALKPNQPVAVYCGGGNRSSVGASILQKHGFKEVYNVVGGMRSWKAAKFPTEKGK